MLIFPIRHISRSANSVTTSSLTDLAVPHNVESDSKSSRASCSSSSPMRAWIWDSSGRASGIPLHSESSASSQNELPSRLRDLVQRSKSPHHTRERK